MKIAVISDVHSNKDALNAAFVDMEKRGVDKIICLGDIVTKYIYPREVVEALKTSCDFLVKGNCDQNVVNNQNYKYARSKLGLENIEFLDSLPIVVQKKYQNILCNFFHATPTSNDKIFNPLQDTNYEEMLIGKNAQVNFAGHTHIPSISVISPQVFFLTNESLIFLKSDGKYVVNVGSVGDPLIKNPNLTSTHDYLVAENFNYAILTLENNKSFVEKISVQYKNLFVKIYLDFVNKQQLDQNGKRFYPRSPKDTGKLYESLQNMNVCDMPEPNEIDKTYTR